MAKQGKRFTVAASMKRGDEIARGGTAGLFVGYSKKTGLWVAWDKADFDKMCRAFDAQN